MTEVGETGQARVRRHLLERGDEAGLKRPAKMTVETFGRWRDRLVAALDHMTPDNLETLAELVIANAAGRRHDEWPAEVLVRQFAKGLQPRPAGQGRIVTSWLASVEGPAAEAGGYLVELHQFLLARGRPPSEIDMRTIRAEAASNHREVERITRRADRGTADEADRVWLEAFRRAEARAQALVRPTARVAE